MIAWLWFGFFIFIMIVFSFIMTFIILPNPDSNSITFVSQYTVSNYSSDDGAFKLFLLSKDRLNGSIILTNENDITEKILVTRIPYY